MRPNKLPLGLGGFQTLFIVGPSFFDVYVFCTAILRNYPRFLFANRLDALWYGALNKLVSVVLRRVQRSCADTSF